MWATASGYFATSYFFHICTKEGCALFFFAGGCPAALSASGRRSGLQSSDGLLKRGGVIDLLLRIPTAKIMKFIKRVITLIIII